VVGDGTWLTVGEAAKALGVDEQTIRRYADAGRLDDPVKAARLAGGHRRIHRDSVERLRGEMYGAPEPAE
jgi:excisionase family DNA binding protein